MAYPKTSSKKPSKDEIKTSIVTQISSVLADISPDTDLMKCGAFLALASELAQSRLLVGLWVYPKQRKGKEYCAAKVRFIDEPTLIPESGFLCHLDFTLAAGWRTDQVFDLASLLPQDSVEVLAFARAFIDQSPDVETWVFPTGIFTMAATGIASAKADKIFRALLEYIRCASDFSDNPDEKPLRIIDLTPVGPYFKKVYAGNTDATLEGLWKSLFGPLLEHCIESGKNVELLAITNVDSCNIELKHMQAFAKKHKLAVHEVDINIPLQLAELMAQRKLEAVEN